MDWINLEKQKPKGHLIPTYSLDGKYRDNRAKLPSAGPGGVTKAMATGAAWDVQVGHWKNFLPGWWYNPSHWRDGGSPSLEGFKTHIGKTTAALI